LASVSSGRIDCVISELGTIQSNAHDITQRIYAIQSKYGYYQDEIGYVVNASGGEFAGSVEYGAKNLVFALNGVTGIPNSNTFAILQPWTSAFDEGCRTFATKIDQTKR
jgi:hypothetical protein